ncbi:anthrone oxygenase family protein [Arthrobacter sp. TmT3-37]
MIQATAIVGAGLVGGIYAAFSTMVIPALGRLDRHDATAAMLLINRKAERGTFILLFGSAAAAAIGLAISAVPRGAVTDMVIASTSLASTVVTMTINVPLNRQLAREGADFWAEYRRRWTTANTVRAALATTAVVVASTHWIHNTESNA